MLPRRGRRLIRRQKRLARRIWARKRPMVQQNRCTRTMAIAKATAGWGAPILMMKLMMKSMMMLIMMRKPKGAPIIRKKTTEKKKTQA